VRRAKGGAVSFIQRGGDGLNLNVHFHSLVFDGVYVEDTDGFIRFKQVGLPSNAEVTRVAGQIARRIEKLTRIFIGFRHEAAQAGVTTRRAQ